jgi:hypothetical protein
MSIAAMGDVCDTEERLICKHMNGNMVTEQVFLMFSHPDWNRYKGVISKTYTSRNCCSAMGGGFKMNIGLEKKCRNTDMLAKNHWIRQTSV